MVEPANLSSAIGIAVSSDHIRAVTLENDVVTSTQVFEVTAEDPLLDQIKKVCESTPGNANIGIAVPGMIDLKTSKIVDSRISELTGIDLKTELGGSVVVENDVNAAAFAELKTGAGRGRRNIFCAILGEGVGSGLILNGEIWHGSHGFAGEFGLIVVDEEGSRLEDVASAQNLVRRTRNRLQQDSTSVLSSEREGGVNLEDILGAAAEGDDLSRLMLERTGFSIGTAIGAVINLLDVGLIVIGGELTKTGGTILDGVIQGAKECASQHSFEATDIVVSELGEDAAAIGAAFLACRS